MMSAQTIMQNLFALQSLQYVRGQNPGDAALERQIRELEDRLRSEIFDWGGLEKIEDWLRKNDPGHGVPSDMRNLDWSWLQKDQ